MPFRNELNTKEEMLKRLSYVFYVLILFFGVCFAIMAIAMWQASSGMIAALLAISAYTLRSIGTRYLDFPRLALSFPLGAPEDALSRESRIRFEGLILAFHNHRDWTERQDIRRHIAEMVHREPLLAWAFRQELKDVHPTLLFDISSPS